ncbi:MAG: aspartate aminotransferase family protein [Acidimicrobiia bacterium]|nr:aspartate aminotransferase family protein [Acidimicrobiia bacterium]
MTVETSTSQSAELYERALRTLPGGVSRNTVLRTPHPLYVDHAEGCRVTDIEGVERIDFANNMASLIHGHAQPAIIAAVSEQIHKGTAFTLATEIEIAYAEHLTGRSISFERIRFVNSGTEAVMGALKAARAATGRPKVAKVEGAYHGLYDFAEVSQTSNPTNWGSEEKPQSVPVAHGTPAMVLENVVVLPFNDPERATAILDEHKGEIACVIVDPMPHRVGLVPAEPAYVDALRTWTADDGALLVFDEVITFRTEYGGFQERYHVVPDLTAMGKIIGGGFPVGAIAGSAEVMEVMNPLASSVRFPHSGTFSANPVTMSAGLVAMRLFDHEAVARLNGLASRAVTGIQEAIEATGIDACVTGTGSMFRVHLKPEPPLNHREAFLTKDEAHRLGVLLDHLFDAGFMMINTCSATLSTPMGEPEIDALIEAFAGGFEKIS